ncbi:dynamin family protein [Gordonia insulae]|uniref:Isoniazid-induced protein IniA n=1 Tax=Gordonia insulae TaxID=2420509 RepID=A0A3G8JK17_9ACTN|nr:dynamin family protein [Gordonia insulae]AZG44550.1 Isoniazid-induced protein IniA [Gordonia insulae]
MDANTTKVCQIIDRLCQLARDAGREDLSRRMSATRLRVVDPSARVVVVGQLKQGKSQLINALLNVPVCRMGDGETTSTITTIGYAEEPHARLIVSDSAQDVIDSDARPGPVQTEGERAIPIPMDDISRDLARAPEAGGAQVLRLEVHVPSPLLQRGIVLVDTPGSGGVGSPHAAATLGLLAASDAIIVASDVSQEYTAPEMSFIRQVTELCDNALCVATKTDLYPMWRDVVAADVAHLRRQSNDVDPLPVSSLLRSHAIRLDDRDLNEESGFPGILEFLETRVLAQASTTMRRLVMNEIRSVTDHLSLAVRPELETLKDPGAREAIVAELERARTEARELSSRTALWQQVLGDGIADLSAESDHDLRNRTRRLLKDYESRIDAGDPAKFWTQLGEDLKNDIAEAVGDNFIWTHDQSLAVAERVADSFSDTGDVAIPRLDLAAIGHEISPQTGLTDLEQQPTGVVHKVVTGMRGSYGGMMMFGMMSTMVGMTMLNPFSVAAGVLLGRKSYKEDAEMRLTRRRSEAKMAVRTFVDDVLFEVGRESRYRLRTIQRVLRDHFREIAEQTTRSLTESIKAAEDGARTQVADRDARSRRLEASLGFLDEVSAWAAGGCREHVG